MKIHLPFMVKYAHPYQKKLLILIPYDPFAKEKRETLQIRISEALRKIPDIRVAEDYLEPDLFEGLYGYPLIFPNSYSNCIENALEEEGIRKYTIVDAGPENEVLLK